MRSEPRSTTYGSIQHCGDEIIPDPLHFIHRLVSPVQFFRLSKDGAFRISTYDLEEAVPTLATVTPSFLGAQLFARERWPCYGSRRHSGCSHLAADTGSSQQTGSAAHLLLAAFPSLQTECFAASGPLASLAPQAVDTK